MKSKENKKITIREIAKEAGVAIGTVSNVINNSSIVSKDLKDKVNKIIQKYNYKVNIPASNLKRKTSRLFGIILLTLQSAPVVA